MHEDYFLPFKNFCFGIKLRNLTNMKAYGSMGAKSNIMGTFKKYFHHQISNAVSYEAPD
jgi:hypothetical protein